MGRACAAASPMKWTRRRGRSCIAIARRAGKRMALRFRRYARSRATNSGGCAERTFSTNSSLRPASAGISVQNADRTFWRSGQGNPRSCFDLGVWIPRSHKHPLCISGGRTLRRGTIPVSHCPSYCRARTSQTSAAPDPGSAAANGLILIRGQKLSYSAATMIFSPNGTSYVGCHGLFVDWTQRSGGSACAQYLVFVDRKNRKKVSIFDKRPHEPKASL
jgi:hypothetical protein